MKKLFTLVAAALMCVGAQAEDTGLSSTVETKATLVHTAGSSHTTNDGKYVSDVDAEKEYVNNSKMDATNWQGCAYADFSFEIPEGEVFVSATLNWSGIGSGKNRNTDVLYVNDPTTIDYSEETGFASGTAQVNLAATYIQTVTFPANATTPFTTDVTAAVKEMISGGYSNVIFKFTNNVGSGYIVGKGATEGAPELVIVTARANTLLFHTAGSSHTTNDGKYVSDVDAEKEYVNNSKMDATNWQGCAYADFQFVVPEGLSLTGATLKWNGIGSGKNRNTDVLYVNDPTTIDYSEETGFASGTAQVNLAATYIQTVTFPANATTPFETDVTEAVRAMIEGGYSNVIFKFTNNVGSGYIVGKGATEGAPELVLTTTAAATTNYFVVRQLDAETQLDTITYKGAIVGSEATINDDDVTPYYKDGVKYVWDGNEVASIELGDEEKSNYIYVTYREADQVEWQVNGVMVDGENEYVKPLHNGIQYVGETQSFGYPTYLADEEGNLYKSTVNNKQWGSSMGITDGENVANINYDKTEITGVVYCEEGEQIEGLTPITEGNTAVRSSDCASANGAGGMVNITELDNGTYTLHVGLYDATKNFGNKFNFYLDNGDESMTLIKANDTDENTFVTTVVNYEEKEVQFIVKENANLVFEDVVPATSNGLDFLYIVKNSEYNYIEVEAEMPDTIKVEVGESVSLMQAGNVTVNGNYMDFAPYFGIAKVEEGADKTAASYEMFDDELAIQSYIDENGEGIYYAFVQINALLTDTPTEVTDQVFTDTIVISATKPEEIIEEHTWSFMNFGEATIANLKAEAAKVTVSAVEGKDNTTTCVNNDATWSDHEKAPGKECDTYAISKDKCFWFFGSANADGQLEANGEVIEELKGLTFNNETYNASRAIAIALDYPSTTLGNYKGGSYIWMGGKNGSFTIKNVVVGSIIKMGVESHKSTDKRGVKLTVNDVELTDPNGNAVTPPTTYTEQTWLVPAPVEPLGAKGDNFNATVADPQVVDVVVTNTNGCHIYYIDAEIDENATGVEAVTEEVKAAAPAKFIKNGQLIIATGDKQFNAAGGQLK